VNTEEKPSAPERPFRDALKITFWKTLPWLAAIGVIVLILIGLRIAISSRAARLKRQREEAARNRAETTVNVMAWTIEPRTLLDTITLPGRIEAWEQLTVEAEVSGRIVALDVDEGKTVKKSDPLARIDSVDYKAQVAQADAALVLAKQELERTRRLHKDGAVPQASLDAALSLFRQREAALTTARNNLQRCTIRAPFGGVINRRHVAIGTRVNPGTPVMELLDTHKVKAEVGIPEADVDKVRDLDEARITVESLGGREFTGKKHFLALRPMEVAQVYRLELALDNPGGELRPGMFVDAHIVRSRYPNSIVVPLFSAIARDEEQFCFVIEDGRAVRKDVKLGLIKGKTAQILEGLKGGEALIVVGHRQLDDGGRVSIIKTVKDPSELTK
jgi:membrane fusion protein, multidrug efflux system